MCVRERERVCERERVRERERVCERECVRENVCERERECVCNRLMVIQAVSLVIWKWSNSTVVDAYHVGNSPGTDSRPLSLIS